MTKRNAYSSFNRNSSNSTGRSAPCQETSSINSSHRLAYNHHLLRKVSQVSSKYDDKSKIDLTQKMLNLKRPKERSFLIYREPRRSMILITNSDMEDIKTSLTNDMTVQISNGWIEPSNYSIIDHNNRVVMHDEISESETKSDVRSFMSAKTECTKVLSDNGEFSFWNMSATTVNYSEYKIKNKITDDNGTFSYWSVARCA